MPAMISQILAGKKASECHQDCQDGKGRLCAQPSGITLAGVIINHSSKVRILIVLDINLLCRYRKK